jgi:hypothetical protein
MFSGAIHWAGVGRTIPRKKLRRIGNYFKFADCDQVLSSSVSPLKRANNSGWSCHAGIVFM